MAAEEFRVEFCPVFRDGIAHKDHLGIIAALDNTLVVGFIVVESELVL